jgi:hypothetical protein
MSVVLFRTPAGRDGWLSLMLFPDAHNSGLLNSLRLGQSAYGEFGAPEDVSRNRTLCKVQKEGIL